MPSALPGHVELGLCRQCLRHVGRGPILVFVAVPPGPRRLSRRLPRSSWLLPGVGVGLAARLAFEVRDLPG